MRKTFAIYRSTRAAAAAASAAAAGETRRNAGDDGAWWDVVLSVYGSVSRRVCCARREMSADVASDRRPSQLAPSPDVRTLHYTESDRRRAYARAQTHTHNVKKVKVAHTRLPSVGFRN